MYFRHTVFFVLAAASPLWPSARADDSGPSTRKLTPIQRMAAPRLKATHEDVARIREARRGLPGIPGLHDYRAILHAHAEDSAHTGGTRPEILAEAQKAGVSAILLSDHYRPPRDFVNDSWRGLHEGVLFLPGSEARGFLVYPTRSVMSRMDQPVPQFVQSVTADGGLIFLSHIEERPDHPMDGLNGQEIYNRHADAKKDKAGLLALVFKLTSPASLKELENSLRDYPDELFAFQVEYPAEYLAKWDRETVSRRLTGVAANDCHHNMVMIMKMINGETVKIGTIVDKDEDMRAVSAVIRPGIRELTRGRHAGEVLARLDLDPYHRSFRNVCTHILAPSLTEAAVRDALRAGRAYVCHDWMCDPTGFSFTWTPGRRDDAGASSPARFIMGDEAKFDDAGRLLARFPVSCHIRLLEGGRVVAEARGETLEHTPARPGVYRVEGWLTLDNEERGWLYSNPIYLR